VSLRDLKRGLPRAAYNACMLCGILVSLSFFSSFFLWNAMCELNPSLQAVLYAAQLLSARWLW
jgi:hypothetical protein